jgi:small membrane protein
MSIAAILLLGLVLALVLFDAISQFRKNRRGLVVEIAVFLVGAFFIVFPERATELAHLVGIGRGVDFMMYPIVIWLTRESLLTRRRRLEDAERITSLTRELALVTARYQSASPATAEFETAAGR